MNGETPAVIPIESGNLKGDLYLPKNVSTKGLILFAHGSGSSRHSPRNKFVAQILQEGGLGTLLMDLLTAEEGIIDQETAHLRFNIELLANRLLMATKWVLQQSDTQKCNLGYFGSSTGAAAALVAAAKYGGKTIRAVVSRGGRPDLAKPILPHVNSPTLLIVGEYDNAVIQLNEEAYHQLPCYKKLEIIPRATHLFEEPGALENVACLAKEWFELHLLKETSARLPTSL